MLPRGATVCRSEMQWQQLVLALRSVGAPEGVISEAFEARQQFGLPAVLQRYAALLGGYTFAGHSKPFQYLMSR